MTQQKFSPVMKSRHRHISRFKSALAPCCKSEVASERFCFNLLKWRRGGRQKWNKVKIISQSHEKCDSVISTSDLDMGKEPPQAETHKFYNWIDRQKTFHTFSPTADTVLQLCSLHFEVLCYVRIIFKTRLTYFRHFTNHNILVTFVILHQLFLTMS